jgi:nucleotide-binding universal stress UspA family protein
MARTLPSFGTTLVPLDGSPLAEQALPLASRIAQRAGGKLRLALVHELPSPPVDLVGARMFASLELATRNAERSYLRNTQRGLRAQGLRLSSAVTLKGDPAPELVRFVRETGIDLVIMATHGRGGLQRMWLGSVADHLIRQLEVPVLLVRPEQGKSAPAFDRDPMRILVPLDGSPLAEQALEQATRLARVYDAEITLLQVVFPVQLSVDPALPLPSAYDQELTESCRSQAEDYLRGLSERLREHGVRASGVAVVGWNAADRILELARPEQTDLIVIATHGRGGLGRLTLGSVADKLVRAADVPVLVCRPSKSAAKTGWSPRRSRGAPAVKEA